MAPFGLPRRYVRYFRVLSLRTARQTGGKIIVIKIKQSAGRIAVHKSSPMSLWGPLLPRSFSCQAFFARSYLKKNNKERHFAGEGGKPL
ncbi:MAG: hypothetical protein AB1921_06235, partial [Thermodesulfobacteriota bacterium]